MTPSRVDETPCVDCGRPRRWSNPACPQCVVQMVAGPPRPRVPRWVERSAAFSLGCLIGFGGVTAATWSVTAMLGDPQIWFLP